MSPREGSIERARDAEVQKRQEMHMLCHGYQRTSVSRLANFDHNAAGVIPGILSYYPNHHVNTLKGAVWSSVLGLLGKEAERLMVDLLLDNDIFIAVATGSENYYQLSGEATKSDTCRFLD